MDLLDHQVLMAVQETEVTLVALELRETVGLR